MAWSRLLATAAVTLCCAARFAMSDSAFAAAISPSVVVSNLQIAPSVTAQTGALTVFFAAPPQLSVDVAGFQLSLAIVGPDDAVKFESVVAPLSKPYLLAPESTGPFASISAGGSRVKIGDFLNAGYGQARDNQGLAEIHVSVSPSAAGKSYLVSVDLDPAESYLGISSALLLPITAVQNGTISIVPEPQSLFLAAILLVAAGPVRATYSNRIKRTRNKFIC
jgi:hypothetical protein